MTSLSPKALFLQDRPRAERLNNLTATTDVQESITVAFAEMGTRMQARDTIMAAVNASKLEGAREFLTIWLNLGRQSEPVQTKPEWPALKPT